MNWTVQGIHETTSDIHVSVCTRTPVASHLDSQWSIRLEPEEHSAFLLPEQARHLASVLLQAADIVERQL